jgi:hypothetical protein
VTGTDTLRRQLEALARLPERATRDAADAVCQLAADVGGSVVLGKKRRPYKLKAKPQFYAGRAGEFRCTVWGTPTGPWVWKNSGTRAHVWPKRKRRKARFVHGAGFAHPYDARTPVHVRGIPARHRWTRDVVQRARTDVVPAAFRKAVAEAVSGRG